MNQIPAVPSSVTKAGLNFNYALWTAGTVVTLTTVEWDSSYRNVVNFPKGKSIDKYIETVDSNTKVTNMKHQRINQDVRVDVPFERAAFYNYLRAENPKQPVSGSFASSFYYFILDVVYIAPNTTLLKVQLDVWATFKDYTRVGRSYLERGHAGVANENANLQNGKQYLTVPEGMDIGGEMEIAGTYMHPITSAKVADSVQPNFAIMVTATTDLTKTGSSDQPKVTTSGGSRLENLPNGVSIYFFNLSSTLQTFLDNNSDKPWVTQAITSIVVIPPLDTLGMNLKEANVEGIHGSNKVFVVDNKTTIPNRDITIADDWTTKLNLDSRYKYLDKLKTSPYTMIELTSFSGQPLVLKPENLKSRKIDVTLMVHLNPGSARLTYIPKDYNAGKGANSWAGSVDKAIDSGEWLDFASSITNLPTFSTVNNSQAAYLASNKNQIAFEYKNASWDQQRAMAGAQTAYGNAMNTKQTGVDQSRVGMRQIGQTAAQNNQTEEGRAIVGGTQAAMGGFSQAAGGNPVGGVINGVTGTGASYANMQINQMQNTAMSGINQRAMGQSADLQAANQGEIADANRNLADSVARGDYANAIAGIQAKVQDAQVLQPTTSGQVGGDAFNLATIGWIISARVKRMAGVPMTEVGEYWLRYGYRVNRWMIPPRDLHVASHFSYWQMQDAQVFADACPEQYRNTIRGILEKGVTVWKDPQDIGWLDPGDNIPYQTGIKF